MSKNARCIGVQNPLALTSDLAPGPLMVDFRSKVSPVMGMSGGSIATSLYTYFLQHFCEEVSEVVMSTYSEPCIGAEEGVVRVK